MKVSRLVRVAAALAAGGAVTSLVAQTNGTAAVRHAPVINGTVEGSVQQLSAENVTLNGGARVSGDLLVPGTPVVRLNGSPTYGGTLDGSGAATPTGFQIILNGSAALRHVVRRTDPGSLPVVTAPPAPAGTRSVSITSTAQSIGDFATLRHLALSGTAGQVTIPPGTYGDFSASASTAFALGVKGATSPATYNFQHLVLSGQAQLRLEGPVIITVADGFTAGSKALMLPAGSDFTARMNARC